MTDKAITVHWRVELADRVRYSRTIRISTIAPPIEIEKMLAETAKQCEEAIYKAIQDVKTPS